MHRPHWPVYEHAPAIMAGPAVYCIHGRFIRQARGRQTVLNVNEKQAQQTPICRRTAQTSNTV